MAEDTAITIYSTATPGSINPDMYRPVPTSAGGWGNYGAIPGYGIVREQRKVSLNAGSTDLKYSDVAAYIDPTTVTFKSLTDANGTSVLEQNYNFDLVSTQKLIEKYVDQNITVEQSYGNSIATFQGKLLTSNGGMVLQDSNNKLVAVQGYSSIKFPDLPSGLITKPTLNWKINAKKGGEHKIETSYQTTGITWWADYIANYKEGKSANEGSIDLSAWVSIINKAGATFSNAKLKLVAGDVNRAKPQNVGYQNRMYKAAAMEMADNAGFEEKAFFEYHLYTLGRNVDIPDNSTKQLELFTAAHNVPVTKEYIYYGASQPYYGYLYADKGYDTGNKKVDVYIKFKNSEKEKLGMPLPSGRIRVNQIDNSDGSMEFIGEDIIDHTPKDEDVKIKMGSAFDIVGERKQTNFFYDANRHILEETIEIKLRNHRKEKVDITVLENLYRGNNWSVTKSSHKYEKDGAFTIKFIPSLAKDAQEVITYTVKYTW
jgi:hypothetical protein